MKIKFKFEKIEVLQNNIVEIEVDPLTEIKICQGSGVVNGLSFCKEVTLGSFRKLITLIFLGG